MALRKKFHERSRRIARSVADPINLDELNALAVLKAAANLQVRVFITHGMGQ